MKTALRSPLSEVEGPQKSTVHQYPFIEPYGTIMDHHRHYCLCRCHGHHHLHHHQRPHRQYCQPRGYDHQDHPPNLKTLNTAKHAKHLVDGCWWKKHARDASERQWKAKANEMPNEKAKITSPMTPMKRHERHETPKSSGASECHHLRSS